jgi:TetR/AcrR family transcriptional regulator, cholesterol catabolism regulator
VHVSTQATWGVKRSGPATAKELRDVAAQLFWQKGYAATTTRELADALGVQKASLYYHMRSKEDLLHDICIESLNNILGAVAEAIAYECDPLARVRALIKAHVLVQLQDKEKHATMLKELEALSPDRRADVLALKSEYESLVRDVLAHAQDAGALSRDMTAQELELGLLNLLNWTIFWFRPEGDLTPARLAEMFEHLYLRGATPRDEPRGRTRARREARSRPKGCG